MAARRTVKQPEETLILPPITSNLARSKPNVGKTLGNFGTYVLLPSLDPLQNMNAMYDVRKFCKLLCEWYSSWKSWQREVLLCSLSEKCSVNLLTSLSTILEPVFHRDFVSRLHGKYPDFKPFVGKLCFKTLKAENKGNNVELEPGESNVGDLIETDTVSQEEMEGEKDTTSDTCIVKDAASTGEICEQGIEIPTGKLVESNTGPTVGEKFESINNQSSTSNHVSSLTNLIKESLLKNNNDTQNITALHQIEGNVSEIKTLHKSISQVPCQNRDECRSWHIHTANVYNQDTGPRFFSASRFKRLSDMKANLSYDVRSELGRRVSELDQKCFKHRRWWSAEPKENRLVPAQGLNLWKHFAKQLNDINERMESWGDHEKVNVISDVIKSSDPEQINFFAQCLIQRLRDHTDVSILPDQSLLKIFSELDARTLCQISQVSRRWRYLAEDAGLWKNKCFQLGLSNSVNDLIFLIEKSAENHIVDWKQAYQEVYKFFQQSQKQRESPVEVKEEEFEEPVESTSTTSESQQSQVFSEHDRVSEQRVSSTATTAADIQLEYLDLTPTTDGDVLSGSIEDDEDLIGGNLGMLEDALSELTGEKQQDIHEEIAYDIRPNKIQPLNEMEDFDNANHQLLTVGVEDVKSVKRVRKLQGHMDGVYTVQFDQKRCLTGSTDRLLRMWDVRTGRAISTMTGHLGGVRCAQFDNEKILSGSWDTTIMIWDIIKFTCTSILRGHQGCVSCLCFNSSHLTSGSHDMTVRVWDVDTWECLRVLEGHTGEVTCLFLGGTYLLTGSTDKTVKLWNIQSGECLKTLVGHNSSVLSVQACRALVISGSEEGKIMFWDVEQGSPVAIIQAHDGPCNCLFVWGSNFLSGGGDALVKQWDIATMTCLRTLQGHKGPVQSVKMSWSKIISASEDGTVRIWDLEAPIHKLGRQYDEFENSLLPFDTLEHDDEES